MNRYVVEYREAFELGAVLSGPAAVALLIVAAAAMRSQRHAARAGLVGSIAAAAAVAGIGFGVVASLEAEIQALRTVVERPDLAALVVSGFARWRELLLLPVVSAILAVALCTWVIRRGRRFAGREHPVRGRVLLSGVLLLVVAGVLAAIATWSHASVATEALAATGHVSPEQREAFVAGIPAYALEAAVTWLAWTIPAAFAGTALVATSFAPRGDAAI